MCDIVKKMYDDLPCVFWLARVRDGKKELRFEEYQKYLEEWENSSYITKCIVKGYVDKSKSWMVK